MEERKVWNCIYLRNTIFNFLRKKPKKICYFCKCVLIWDNKVREPYYIECGDSICKQCHRNEMK
jgi:hypothetical protein